MKLKVSIIILLVSFVHQGISQEIIEEEKPSYWEEHFEFGGYIKYMNTNSFRTLDTIFTDNLFHNRLNFKYNPDQNWSIILEARNRLLHGDSVKNIPGFSDNIDNDNGIVDASFNLIDASSVIFNSTIDRGYVEYNKNKWNIRLGRQRINWGINLAWNPNDLYNAYNFTDFDYAERPGSDAIRIQYFSKALSKIELAYKPGKDLDESIISTLYKFNKKSYDIQFLVSNFNTDLAIGTGWAGNLWQAGFKGEATYFHPKESLSDTSGVLATSISLDYTFSNGIYINVSGLYNGSATGSPLSLQLGSNAETLSAKNLFPSKFTSFVQVSGAFSPIFNAGLSVIYLSDFNGVFLNPTLSYSIKENWDLDAVGQILFAERQTKFQNVSNSIFLRIRWSF